MRNYHPSDLGLGTVTPGSVVTPIGGGIIASAPLFGPTAPLVALIGGGVALAGQFLNIFGVGVPDMKKIQASNSANDVEQIMAQIQTWWNGVEHTTANQQMAVTAWYQAWDRLTQLCGDPNLGSAGKNCIGDRQRGGKWDWFAMHLDPIMNTPLTDSGTATGAVNSLLGGTGLSISSSTLMIFGIAIVGLAIITSD